MAPRSPIRPARTPLGQAAIPLALLLLLALVAGLMYQTRRMEASHRATAESALRDYAAFAAWEYSREAGELVHQTSHTTLHTIERLLRGNTSARLPLPDALLAVTKGVSCGIVPDARFAFRLDLPGRELRIAGGTVDAVTRRALISRLSALADSAPRRDPVLMLIDTLGGEPRAIAYGVVYGLDSLPRAVYGVEASPSSLSGELRVIAKSQTLLPPSLTGDRPIDSLLVLELRSADGNLLVALGEGPPGTLAAQDTTGAQGGALITTVALRPATASTLLIGGLPTSRLPMLVMLFGASVAVAGIALVQLRRGRELARLRSQFVANVSHELRTPLAQISMFSETLLLGRERSSDERHQFLSIIFREARRLTHLVESALQFSRAEVGSRALRREERDIAEDVRDAVRAFSPLAAAAGVEIRTEVEGQSFAHIDPDALRQVLINLLDNAVKFGPDGQRITIGVTSSGNQVIVSVTDQGPGIPATDRLKVFAPFTQLAHTNGRVAAGAGIGLAVVAERVAAHGGRVWIEDAPSGHGTRAVFTLPALERARVPGTERPRPLDAPVGIAPGAATSGVP